MKLRCGLFAILMALFTLESRGQTASSLANATGKGRGFLTGLYDAELKLLPEYRGANVYWLYHDNYLAAKVLAARDPKMAKSIQRAIRREDVRKPGGIELIFGEAKKPLPFREYQLRDVRGVGNKVIRTEEVTGRVLEGWEQYADLLLQASIAEHDRKAARKHWDAAMQMWDGKGFLDAAARESKRYATYKLGLALLAGSRLSPPAKPPEGLVERLLSLQDESGGWITDYDASGKKIGVANVETTCLVILGIETWGGFTGETLRRGGGN